VTTHRDDTHSKKVLYTTIVDIIFDMKDLPTIQHHQGRGMLAKALEQCGSRYYTFATIVDEQGLTGRDPVVSSYWCDLCPSVSDKWMRGTRFACTNCIKTDLCTDCYKTWQKCDGQMDVCKGHTFREVPRPCWYTLEPGTVTEDGKTIKEVLDYLREHFTQLLRQLDDGIMLSSS
jgi:hypothetical protein